MYCFIDSCFWLDDLIVVIKHEACRGYGGFGALGHSVYTRELFPRLVEGSWSGRIQHVSTSGTHTAAITESGLSLISIVGVIFILAGCMVLR